MTNNNDEPNQRQEQIAKPSGKTRILAARLGLLTLKENLEQKSCRATKSAQKQGRRRPHNQGPRRNLLGPCDSRGRENPTGGAQAGNETGARKTDTGTESGLAHSGLSAEERAERSLSSGKHGPPICSRKHTSARSTSAHLAAEMKHLSG
jgi:hypothetical protein